MQDVFFFNYYIVFILIGAVYYIIIGGFLLALVRRSPLLLVHWDLLIYSQAVWPLHTSLGTPSIIHLVRITDG